MDKKADSKIRKCVDCEADISKRGISAKRCVQCADNRTKKLQWKRKENQHYEPRHITDKQKAFIEKLMDEAGFDFYIVKEAVEEVDGEILRGSIEDLSVNQASGLIDYLLKNKAGKAGLITQKQKDCLQLLLSETGYNYEQIIILAKRDGAIKPKEEISGLDNLNIRQASGLIGYLIEIHEYLGL